MAARATPSIPQRVILIIIVTASSKIGTMVLLYPRARPKIILIAEPEVQP